MDYTNENSHVSVGEIVLMGDEYCEVLAVTRKVNYYGGNPVESYHLAYATSVGVTTSLYYSAIRLKENRDIPMEAGASPFTAGCLPKSKYGTPQQVGRRLLALAESNDVSHRVREFVWNELPSRCLENQVRLHEPTCEGPLISLYLTDKDRNRGRRTAMKCGRAFKHMLPNCDEATISKLTEKWVELNAPRDLTVRVGGSRKDFRKAYCGVRATFRNPTTTSSRKSLATSCMHTTKVSVDDGDISPAEVFASGDFSIAWLETKDGHIAGRVVFSSKEGVKKTHAPIYGACEQSLDMLSNYLSEQGVEKDEEWSGLRLLNIKGDYGIVGPYLDCGLRGSEDGGYITLCDDGDLTFERTDGYTDDGVMCSCCGGPLSEDEAYHVDGETMCECCFDETYVYLEAGDICHLEDAVEAATLGWNNRVTYVWVHNEEAVYCELVEEYWCIEDTTMSECGEYVPTYRIGDFPELFPADEEEEEEAS